MNKWNFNDYYEICGPHFFQHFKIIFLIPAVIYELDTIFLSDFFFWENHFNVLDPIFKILKSRIKNTASLMFMLIGYL